MLNAYCVFISHFDFEGRALVLSVSVPCNFLHFTFYTNIQILGNNMYNGHNLANTDYMRISIPTGHATVSFYFFVDHSFDNITILLLHFEYFNKFK